jgi:hypothetical protein
VAIDDFAPEAPALRKVFDDRFAEPRKAHPDRFRWDLWHVPGQYTALRTPAYHYFPARLYRAFHQRLVWWGRRTLGCHDVSPPWLSCYVDGCRQELHGDLPHGPFAFVFSLTHWASRTFRGGETLLLRDDVLDFWDGFVSERSIESPDVLRAVEPRFGRLVVFDPRIPHGVRPIEGTMDPRHGRLVIHGWFVNPRPFIEGPLPRARLGKCIDNVTAALEVLLARPEGLPVAGTLSLGFRVNPSGRTGDVRVLADTTRVTAPFETRRRALVRQVIAAVRAFSFGRLPAPALVTLPLVFSRQSSSMRR